MSIKSELTHRAAAVWRDPLFPPPAVAHWHSTPFSAPTAASATAKARRWCRSFGPDGPVAVVYLGSGVTAEASA